MVLRHEKTLDILADYKKSEFYQKIFGEKLGFNSKLCSRRNEDLAKHKQALQLLFVYLIHIQLLSEAEAVYTVFLLLFIPPTPPNNHLKGNWGGGFNWLNITQ